MILGEGEGFDFWVPEKREDLRVLVLVFRRELGFVLGRKSFLFFFYFLNIYIFADVENVGTTNPT